MSRVPLVRVNRLSDEQLADVRLCLQEHGVAYSMDKETLPRQRFIYVDEKELERSRGIVKQEFADFAQRKRALWEEEWRREYGGSYWRWLRHQLLSKPREAVFRILNLF